MRDKAKSMKGEIENYFKTHQAEIVDHIEGAKMPQSFVRYILRGC